MQVNDPTNEFDRSSCQGFSCARAIFQTTHFEAARFGGKAAIDAAETVEAAQVAFETIV